MKSLLIMRDFILDKNQKNNLSEKAKTVLEKLILVFYYTINVPAIIFATSPVIGSSNDAEPAAAPNNVLVL